MKTRPNSPLAMTVACIVINAALASGDISPGVIGIRCWSSDHEVPDGAGATEDCGSLGATGSVPMCYAVFRFFKGNESAEVIERGCWSRIRPEYHELAEMQEDRGACSSRTSGSHSVQLCRCIGDLCNLNLVPDSQRLRTIAEKPPARKASLRYPKLLLAAAVFGSVMVALIAKMNMFGAKECFQSLVEGMKVWFKNREKTRPPPRVLPLDKVTLVERIASGRFGVVWEGRIQGKPVAVKICSELDHRVCLNEVEIYSLPGMNHPNILRFLGAAQQSDSRSNLQECRILTTLHGLGSLEDYLRTNTVSCAQLLSLAESIAAGVMHLHSDYTLPDGSRKPTVAHRDIKSKNILLRDAYSACIGDFGLAIAFGRGKPAANVHSQAGTPRYMAPEVLEAATDFDRNAFQMMDMYAVALVIWEIMSRTESSDRTPEYKLPYEELVGTQPSIEDMWETVVNQKRRPTIRADWKSDRILSLMATTLEETWDSDAEARLTASTVYERLYSLARTVVEIDSDAKEDFKARSERRYATI